MNIGISIDGEYCTAAFSLSDGRLFSLTKKDSSLEWFSINKRDDIKKFTNSLRKKLELLDESELLGRHVVARFSFPDSMADYERNNFKSIFENEGVYCESGNRLIEDRTQLCLFAYERINSFSRPVSGQVAVICVGSEQIDVRNFQRNDTILSFDSIDYFDTNLAVRDKRSIDVNPFEPDRSIHIINDLISDYAGQVLIFDCWKKDEPSANNYLEEIASYLEKSGRHAVKAEKQRDYSAFGAALLNNNISVPYWNGLLTNIEVSISSYGEKKTIKSINGLKEFETNHCIIVPREELCPGGLRLEEYNPGRRQGAGDRCIYQKRIMDNTQTKDIHLEFEVGGALATDD